MNNFTCLIFKIFKVFLFVLIFLSVQKIFATTFTPITLADASTAVVTAGATDQEILRIAVTNPNGGGQGTGTITGMNFTPTLDANNTNVTGAKLYYTGTTSTFATTTQLGATDVDLSNGISFTFSQGMAKGATYYFWLAYDIDAGAAACTEYDATQVVGDITTADAIGTYTDNASGKRILEGLGCWNYCSATHSVGTGSGDYISNVTIDGTTLNNSTTGAASPFYTLFPNSGTTTATLNPGSTYTLKVSGGTYTNAYIGAWIDWNNDGVFNSTDEYLGISPNCGASAQVTLTSSMAVPLTSTGVIRLRLRETYTNTIVSTQACGALSNGFGETEDYYITICPAATAISPTSTMLCSGGSTTLTATAGYTTIQWQTSTDNVSFSNIGGATNSTYNTPALSSTTYYRATYTNTCTSGTTSSVTVTVVSAPAISDHPDDASICKGSGTDMSVTAGPTSATYQWQYSATGAGGWANVSNGTPANVTYANATTSGLTISTTASVAAGTYYYRCNVTACSSMSSSNSAALTVNSNPAASTVSATPNSGTCGTPVSFTATLAGGYTGTIQWQLSSDNVTWVNIYNETASTYAGTANNTVYLRTVQTLLSCTATQASPATVTISGTTTKTFNTASGAWTTAANWTPNGVPSTCDNIVIPSSSTVTVALDAYCHNLTNEGTLNISFQSGKYLNIYGNFINNGSVVSSQLSGTNMQGDCSPCSGIQLMGNDAVWGGTGTYTDLTVAVGDGSNTTMIDDAEIAVLNATKTAVVGKLQMGDNTLKITTTIAQTGSELHVNTGYLWLAITSSMKIDISTLQPEYGTVFNDLGLAATLTISGAWNTIGGTGFYNYEQRAQLATSTIRNSCDHLIRGYYKIWPGLGTVEYLNGGAYTMEVRGDWINNGTFSHGATGTNTASFTGPGLVYDDQTNTYISSTEPQDIEGSSITTFRNLTINNATNGVRLDGVDANVSNILTCTAGPLSLNSQRLTVTNAATTAIARTSGYVVSETNAAANPSILQWNISATAGAHVFPFGTTAGNYIPVTFNNSGNAGNVSISTRPTTADDNQPWPSSVSSMDGSGTNVTSAADRWWEISSTVSNPLPSVNLTLSYLGTENSTTTSPTDTRGVQHWNGSCWDDGKNGGCGTVTASANAGVTSGVGTVAVAGITYFSPFVVVRAASPLPIELLSFDAFPEEDKVLLQWQTATEINNDYFTIERCKNNCETLSKWEVVGSVDGAGTSNERVNYFKYDKKPHQGVSYYRLKQTDYDGKSSHSSIVSVNISENPGIMHIFPNPAEKELFLLVGKSGENIIINDISGKTVLQFTVSGMEETSLIPIDISSLSKGMYFISSDEGNQTMRSKFVKE